MFDRKTRQIYKKAQPNFYGKRNFSEQGISENYTRNAIFNQELRQHDLRLKSKQLDLEIGQLGNASRWQRQPPHGRIMKETSVPSTSNPLDKF